MAHIYLGNGMKVENAVEVPPRFKRRAQKPTSEIAGPLGSLAVATGSPEAVRAIEAAVTALEDGWRDLLEWEQLATNTRKALKDAGKSPDHEPYCPSERGIARTEIVRHELGRAATDLRKLLPRENPKDEPRP